MAQLRDTIVTGDMRVTGTLYATVAPTTLTLTLTTAGWSSGLQQSVTATGVTASNLIQVSAAPASYLEYASCGVYCSTQAANSLTFTCSAKPSVALTVNVIVWG